MSKHLSIRADAPPDYPKGAYIPKGGMCSTCAKLHDDCGDLEFSAMPVISTVDGVHIVRCTEHVRAVLEKVDGANT